jgi:cytochrome c peroxidase
MRLLPTFARMPVGAVVLAVLAGCGGAGNGEPLAGIPAVEPVPVVSAAPVPPLSPLPPTSREALGRQLFHDVNLSQPAGTSCASCHDPRQGFAGNHGGIIGVAVGSKPSSSGLRNTPTTMYGQFTPAFSVTTTNGVSRARGGQFVDGRVDTLAQQALGPLLASAEMNNPSAAAVVAKVASSAYAADFKRVWGNDIFTRTTDAFTAIGQSIEAYERTAEQRPFTSRYDDLLRGRNSFTASERRGMAVFFDRSKGNCTACHTANNTVADPNASLFTNHTYAALGVPRNLAIPANSVATFFDLGLAGPQRSAPAGMNNAAGQFKVPTLRNVALKKAFMHNGFFKSLNDVVTFYATRDLSPQRWYPAGQIFNDLPLALRGNVTRQAPFDLRPGDRPRLAPGDVADVVAFLGTLNDAPAIAAFGTAQ